MTPRRTISSLIIAISTILAMVFMATPAQAATNSTTFWLSSHGVAAPWFSGYSIRTATVGSGASLKIDFAYRYQYYGTFVKPHISLQRAINGKWKTIKTGISYKTKLISLPVYKVPASKTSVKAAYRFKSTAFSGSIGEVTNTSYSKNVHVIYENQKKYTGFKRTIYNDVKAYCGATAIHVRALTGEAGRYSEGQLVITIDPKVKAYNSTYRKSVAIHECAHEREFINYGKSAVGWDKMTAAAAKYFVNDSTPAGVTPTPSGNGATGFDPVEHAADCAALAVNPQGYLGYGGYCNASELKHAKRLITGHKF